MDVKIREQVEATAASRDLQRHATVSHTANSAGPRPGVHQEVGIDYGRTSRRSGLRKP